MYHHINADFFSNRLTIFDEHLKFLSESCNVVLPGETLSSEKINVCMIFDDASFSVYHYVFPLLKKYNLRALLAVPVSYIADSAERHSAQDRLHVPVYEMMVDGLLNEHMPLCSWSELREMSESGLFEIASHTLSHSNLLTNERYETEIAESKHWLEERLQREVHSIALPYGEFNAKILGCARQYYKYIFAIGACDNKNWNGIDGVLFRIYGDNLVNPTALFTPWKRFMYSLRFPIVLKKKIKDRQKFHFDAY
jgi:peptidoglycan/xylan/chitin deacetylase (PgdA/CDA1 family)